MHFILHLKSEGAIDESCCLVGLSAYFYTNVVTTIFECIVHKTDNDSYFIADVVGFQDLCSLCAGFDDP